MKKDKTERKIENERTNFIDGIIYSEDKIKEITGRLNSEKATVVIDLDATLGFKNSENQFVFVPEAHEAIKILKKKYNIVLWTASNKPQIEKYLEDNSSREILEEFDLCLTDENFNILTLQDLKIPQGFLTNELNKIAENDIEHYSDYDQSYEDLSDVISYVFSKIKLRMKPAGLIFGENTILIDEAPVYLPSAYNLMKRVFGKYIQAPAIYSLEERSLTKSSEFWKNISGAIETL